MNITKLFTQNLTVGELTQVRSANVQVRRSYTNLLHNLAHLCDSLRAHGIARGDRVLVLCGSRIEAVEAILATFNLGAVAMPVTPLLGAANLRSIIRDMQPRCCVFEDAPEPEILAALQERGCLLIAMKKSDAVGGALYFGDLIAGGPAALEFSDYPDEQPALLIHSSGSSGSLKVISMTQGALLRFFEYHDFVWSQYSDGAGSLRGTGAMVTGLPLSHLAGLAICLQGLMGNRPTYLLSIFVPELYLRLIEQARCAFIFLVPSLYRRLLQDPYLRTMDKSALRACITGGEGCPAGLVAQIEEGFGVPLITAYSMTECLSGIGHSRREIFGGRTKRSSCGKALFGEVKLCDPQGIENDSQGELWVRNSTVHACYLQPQLNAARLHDGWFRTGDLFSKDAEGDFFHRGRVDDMFICNGKNIYPQEIELLLMKHAAVECVCAAPITCADKGVVPAALIVASQPVSESEIQEFFSRIGPSHAIPQLVTLVDAVPLVGPGKTDRRRAAQLLQAEYESRRG